MTMNKEIEEKIETVIPTEYIKCPFKGCALEYRGLCISMNKVTCKEIPKIFQEDKGE